MERQGIKTSEFAVLAMICDGETEGNGDGGSHGHATVKTAYFALFENPVPNALLQPNKTLTFFIHWSDV
jgi:hypothetical protein